MTVSVIIPCGRMSRFLTDSVASVLSQKIDVLEILVVCPADDDNTGRITQGLIAEGAPLNLLHDPETGPGNARNVGILAARGDIIAFLDADDLWTPDKLSLQIDRLGAMPEVDAVGGLTVSFDWTADSEGLSAPSNETAGVCLPNPGMLICRRSVFDTVGMFEDDLLYAEDFDLLMRIRDFDVPFTMLNVPVLYYRQHDNSMMTANHPRMTSDFRLAAFKSVRRRKKLGKPPATRQLLTGDLEDWPVRVP